MSRTPRINEVIAAFARYRDEMLKALDHPGLPLHTSDVSRSIIVVQREAGTFKQTAHTLGVSFWRYLTRRQQPVGLASAVRERYRAAAPGPAG